MLMAHKGLHFWIVLWDRSHYSKIYIYFFFSENGHNCYSPPINYDQDAHKPTAQLCCQCNGYHGVRYDIITTYVSLWNILLDQVWL
jgi:hypothetical protein